MIFSRKSQIKLKEKVIQVGPVQLEWRLAVRASLHSTLLITTDHETNSGQSISQINV